MASNPQSSSTNEFAKLSWRERISYGAGDLAQNLIFGTIGSMLLFYLTTVYGISAAAGATIFLVVRWINVFWDPWVGAVIDKHEFKSGKYRPYLVYAGIPLTIFSAMLFLPIDAVRGNIMYAFIAYLVTALTYSLVNIPYGALNASLTRDNDEVSTLTTVRMTEANIGNLLVYTFLPLFVQLASPDKQSKDIGLFGLHMNLGDYTSPKAGTAYFTVMAIYMVIGFIMLMCTYGGIKERVLPTKAESDNVKYSDLFAELKRNRPLLVLGLFFLIGFTFMFFGNTVWPFYMQYTVGHSEWISSINLIGSIPGIFLVFLWPIVRKRIGKKQFFYIFLTLFIIGTLILYAWSLPAFRDSVALGYIGRFLQQWGITAATGYMWSLVPEVVSYGEYKSKKRVAGIINALMGLFFKIGLALGGIIPGYINAFTHFDGTAKTQSASALMGIEISMIWVPVVLAVVAMFIMSKYPLSDNDVKKINIEIDERKKEGQL
ncbi:Na+ xyloside symporter related transporter [Paucilactobacillus oligofermentans DSM 15707 = LMG 22743]|uniref:Na+ xyloside symporter related transporter n=1 Tax=Paucilactobacillus oligofermentans DSM 15707 = LMG 22743 TaxID=1423778 RepID=A0A0R1RQ89_9LACO|nr:MFS transporter [Paucilactobacillus oligofermentans]KRL55531.1 Na+ xyloside symporter related transporter [Paucilactobacillus oligofermentans DSM 15707 = LMG 22743]CUS25481.1 Putative xyloside transporter XynT [Paucilactobacillus oligofermentans DSM 15707 = LMG 22743]